MVSSFEINEVPRFIFLFAKRHSAAAECRSGLRPKTGGESRPPAESNGQFAMRIDAVRAEAVRTEAVRAEAVRAEAVRAEAVRATAVRAEAVRATAVRAEAVWTDLAATSFAAAVGAAAVECCLTVNFPAALPLIRDFFSIAMMFPPGEFLIDAIDSASLAPNLLRRCEIA